VDLDNKFLQKGEIMAEFLGDIAFMLDFVVAVSGLIMLYHAGKAGSQLLRASGYLLIIGGILGMACTGYYYFKYHFAGEFESAYAPKHHMMMGGGMMQKHQKMIEKKKGMMKGMQGKKRPPGR